MVCENVVATIPNYESDKNFCKTPRSPVLACSPSKTARELIMDCSKTTPICGMVDCGRKNGRFN